MFEQFVKVDSVAVADAKRRAEDTDYIRKYGPDETFWTHFLQYKLATSADYEEAASLIEATTPEAYVHIRHLRTMADIQRESEEWRALRS